MIRTISYLGLGTMGGGMVSNLLKAGYEVTVWDRTVEKCKPYARKGARVADTPADAASKSELVMYSLSDDRAVDEVVFGTKGILTEISAGQIAMDMSDFQSRYEPGHPAADKNGYVKYPNVDPLVEAMDMREAQRAYEANLSVIDNTRTMMARTVDLLKR